MQLFLKPAKMAVRPENLKVLVACEFSGIVRRAFRRLGFNAWSCDILPAEDGSPYHFQCDVRNVLKHHHWDLLIAHPPCTYLCNSGVRWLHERPERWVLMHRAIDFFLELLHADVPHIAIENPVMHGYAQRLIRKPTQYIQPFQFGHPVSKKTGLWLKNLPKLKPTKIVPKEQVRQDILLEPPSPDRWKKRSRTFSGIAKAMAEQWGEFLLSFYALFQQKKKFQPKGALQCKAG